MNNFNLTVAGLTCEKGSRELYQQVNFDLASGELLHIAGTNGCGKTSLLRQLCTIAPVDEGIITYNGQPINANRDEYQHSFLYIGHDNAHKPQLTAMENLQLDLALRQEKLAQSLTQVLATLGLYKQTHTLAADLSSGQARKLALAKLLLFKVPLWILDEPLTGLDQASIEIFQQMLADHCEQGGAVIFTSHQALNLSTHPIKTLELS